MKVHLRAESLLTDYSYAVCSYFVLVVIGNAVDWVLAIKRNRAPLLRIVAVLFDMVGLGEGGRVERLPWPHYRAVLRILRPAEWAVRRLIVIAARGLVVKQKQARQAPAGAFASGKGKGRVSFRLFDPRQRFDRWDERSIGRGPKPLLRIIDVDRDPRIPLFHMAPANETLPPVKPSDTVNAAALCRRLVAIRQALEDLPRQARRYARWRAKPLAARRPMLVSTLRPGAPPGLGRKPRDEVHAILRECHGLALLLPVTDTS